MCGYCTDNSIIFCRLAIFVTFRTFSLALAQHDRLCHIPNTSEDLPPPGKQTHPARATFVNGTILITCGIRSSAAGSFTAIEAWMLGTPATSRFRHRASQIRDHLSPTPDSASLGPAKYSSAPGGGTCEHSYSRTLQFGI